MGELACDADPCRRGTKFYEWLPMHFGQACSSRVGVCEKLLHRHVGCALHYYNQLSMEAGLLQSDHRITANTLILTDLIPNPMSLERDASRVSKYILPSSMKGNAVDMYMELYYGSGALCMT